MADMDWGKSSYTDSSSDNQWVEENSNLDIKIEEKLYQKKELKKEELEITVYSIDRPERIIVKAKITHD